MTLFPPELDIIIWAIRGVNTKEISKRSQAFFDECEKNHLYLALMKYPADLVKTWWPEIEINSKELTLLRSCLMRPEQKDWQNKIWEIMRKTLNQII